jgi:hypothetical protein
MTPIAVALFNFERGGMRADASYDFDKLRTAFASVDNDNPPALIMLCEAHNYHKDGETPLYEAARALSDQLVSLYVPKLGYCDRGPFPPAIFYDPTRLDLMSWQGRSVYNDQHNVARLKVREPDTEFLAIVRHWDPHSRTQRLIEAGLVDRYAKDERPVIFGGDLNCTASGEHLPQPDWMAADYRARSHKAIEVTQDVWLPATDAIDHLIGRWDGQRRTGGCGFHAIAEMAWKLGVEEAMLPTTNTGINAEGQLLIDYLLTNNAMAKHVDATTYRVHIPDPNEVPPSDHRLVTCTLRF